MLRSQLLRSAYVCGESIKLKATIDNQGEEDVRLKVRLFQVTGNIAMIFVFQFPRIIY